MRAVVGCWSWQRSEMGGKRGVWCLYNGATVGLLAIVGHAFGGRAAAAPSSDGRTAATSVQQSRQCRAQCTG